MSLAKDDAAALAATVEAAGFLGATTGMSCIAFSPATPEANRAIHAKTNEQLLSTLLQQSSGQCIHVTGEMRALADPFHRRLCAELAKRTDSKFTVLYNIPKQYRGSPEGVGKWNARRWRSKGWREKLSAINLIGQAFVDVRAFDTLHEIQYSVFGNRYVQLQEKHPDEEGSVQPGSKRVWLLESERLNTFLTERALEMIGRSEDIPESLFKRFFAKISGVAAQTILSRLLAQGPAPAETILDNDLRMFDPGCSDVLDSLKELGFVEALNQSQLLSITASGQQFVET